MNKENQKLINNLKQLLQKEKGILFCYLFGSRAYQNYTSRSDVDIAVYLNEKKVSGFFEERISLMEKIERFFKKRADVVILNEQKSAFFKYVILREGKLIYERNHQKRIEFEFATLQEYYEFLPFLNKYNQAYIKRHLSI